MNQKRTVIVRGDGITDDTDALQAIVNGEARGIKPDGRPWNEGGSLVRIARTIELCERAATSDLRVRMMGL
jgi:hypothetical protein